jgi:hypothetical protein
MRRVTHKQAPYAVLNHREYVPNDRRSYRVGEDQGKQ